MVSCTHWATGFSLPHSGPGEATMSQEKRSLSGVCMEEALDEERWENNLTKWETTQRGDLHTRRNWPFSDEAGSCYTTGRGRSACSHPRLCEPDLNQPVGWEGVLPTKNCRVWYKNRDLRGRQRPGVDTVPCRTGWATAGGVHKAIGRMCGSIWSIRAPAQSSEDQAQPERR